MPADVLQPLLVFDPKPTVTRTPRTCLSPEVMGWLRSHSTVWAVRETQLWLGHTSPSHTACLQPDILLPMPLGRQSEKIKFALGRVGRERHGTFLMWEAQWRHLNKCSVLHWVKKKCVWENMDLKRKKKINRNKRNKHLPIVSGIQTIPECLWERAV